MGDENTNHMEWMDIEDYDRWNDDVFELNDYTCGFEPFNSEDMLDFKEVFASSNEKTLEPPFQLSKPSDWIVPYRSPEISIYDDFVAMERSGLYDRIDTGLRRCFDAGETYEKFYIIDILSKMSDTTYYLCDEILRVVRTYARDLELSEISNVPKRRMNNVLLMETEMVPVDFVKSKLPVTAIQRYFGVKPLIYIRLLWSMICYERVKYDQGTLGVRILYSETLEDLRAIEKEPYALLILNINK